jgi:uncharacterized protein (DUF1499 family)
MATFRDIFVRIVLVLALLLPVYFAAAALGTKFHLIDWRVGFGQMSFTYGPMLLMGVAALALIALLLAFFTPPRRGMGSALIALLIPALAVGYGLYMMKQAQDIPPIHDISTDLIDPPGFSQAAMQARAAVPGSNDLDLLGAEIPNNPRFGTMARRPVVEVHREAYGDIAAIPTGLDQARAFDLALTLAREQDWTLGHVDAASGAIEASSESFWYGFIDDVVIRVRPDGSGARIDMRSVSRVGASDLGANAKRVRAYLAELRARLEAAGG